MSKMETFNEKQIRLIEDDYKSFRLKRSVSQSIGGALVMIQFNITIDGTKNVLTFTKELCEPMNPMTANTCKIAAQLIRELDSILECKEGKITEKKV